MENKIKQILFWWLLFIGVCLGIKVNAGDSEFNVSIEPVLPDNQVTPTVNYFDLRMSPSQEQQVTINLTNHATEKAIFKVTYSEAKTTSQGVIEYSENEELEVNIPEEQLFTHVISGPEKVELNPKESQEIILTVKMPKTEFDGYIAGGIEFTQELVKEESYSALTAKKSYLIGMRISETDTKLPVDLELKQTSVGIKHYKEAILLSLTNKNGNYVENLKVEANISKKGEQEILFKTNMTQMRMAPYSTLELPIYLDESLMEPGQYTIDLVADGQESYHKEWYQEFKVTQKEVELLKKNQALWQKEKESLPISKVLGYLLASFLIISLGVISYLKKDVILKNKKHKKVRKNEKKNKNNQQH